MTIDWEKIQEYALMVVFLAMLAIVVGFIGIAITASLAITIGFGVYMTIKGFWGIGIPIAGLGILIAVSLLVWLFAKLVAFIKRRKANDD